MAGLAIILVLSIGSKYVPPVHPRSPPPKTPFHKSHHTTRKTTQANPLRRIQDKRASKRAAKKAALDHQTREQYFASGKAREAAAERAGGQGEEGGEEGLGLESPPPYEGGAPRYSSEAYIGGATPTGPVDGGVVRNTGSGTRTVLGRRGPSEDRRDVRRDRGVAGNALVG